MLTIRSQSPVSRDHRRIPRLLRDAEPRIPNVCIEDVDRIQFFPDWFDSPATRTRRLVDELRADRPIVSGRRAGTGRGRKSGVPREKTSTRPGVGGPRRSARPIGGSGSVSAVGLSPADIGGSSGESWVDETRPLRAYVLGPHLGAEKAARHTAGALSGPPPLLTARPEITRSPKKSPAVRSPTGRATSRTGSSGSPFVAGDERIFVASLKRLERFGAENHVLLRESDASRVRT